MASERCCTDKGIIEKMRAYIKVAENINKELNKKSKLRDDLIDYLVKTKAGPPEVVPHFITATQNPPAPGSIQNCK